MTVDYRRYPILFVDDEEANRVVFRASFGKDFTVLLAADGEQALAALREQAPAILIADQRMPGMTGVELAERVREQYPEVVRIIITAYSDLQAAVDAINRGQVALFIRKPWDSDEVRSYLRSAIELRHLNSQVQELQAQVLSAERLATLGLAASSIAHDLNTPVACLLNDLEGIERELDALGGLQIANPSVAHHIEELEEVTGDCRRSLESISQILQAVTSCIRAVPEKEPVALHTVIHTALRLVQNQVRLRAQLKVDCQQDVLVSGDSTALAQLVINLLNNAANAFGGYSSANWVTICLCAQDGEALLQVSDTGCGIPLELRDKIFEPLFTTRRQQGGTGLGLAIIKRAVDNHGGRLELESTPGQGTTFTIRLPLLSSRTGSSL